MTKRHITIFNKRDLLLHVTSFLVERDIAIICSTNKIVKKIVISSRFMPLYYRIYRLSFTNLMKLYDDKSNIIHDNADKIRSRYDISNLALIIKTAKQNCKCDSLRLCMEVESLWMKNELLFAQNHCSACLIYRDLLEIECLHDILQVNIQPHYKYIHHVRVYNYVNYVKIIIRPVPTYTFYPYMADYPYMVDYPNNIEKIVGKYIAKAKLFKINNLPHQRHTHHQTQSQQYKSNRKHYVAHKYPKIMNLRHVNTRNKIIKSR